MAENKYGNTVEQPRRLPTLQARPIPSFSEGASGGLITATKDSTNNNLMADVLGNKEDTPALTASTSASIVAYVKGLTSLWGQQYDASQNTVSSVDVDNNGLFEIALIDKDSGLIPSGDITEGTYDIDRIRAGVTTNIVSGAVPSKASGRVFISYTFANASWQADDVFVVRLTGMDVSIGGNTYYPPIFPWFGRIDEAAAGASNAPNVQDVVIYPLAEDVGITVISDDGSSPPAYPLAGHATSSLTPVAAWTEDINFEANMSVTVISIYAELRWQTQIDNVAGHSYSKVQISGDGGSTWQDMTDVFDNQVAALTDRTRKGVGQWLSAVVVGTNQLQMRLVHYVDDAARTSTAKMRSDSYIRLTYRKV